MAHYYVTSPPRSHSLAVVSLALPEGVMGYKYLASSSSSACCDPNHAGYLGTKKAKHISSFVEFYQVC